MNLKQVLTKTTTTSKDKTETEQDENTLKKEKLYYFPLSINACGAEL